MLLFKYLDNLPRVPDHLIPKEVDIDDKRNYTAEMRTMKSSSGDIPNILYTRNNASQELTEWINQNISNKLYLPSIQISHYIGGSTTHLAHTDSFPRKWVINYVYDRGGENPSTNFYREKSHPLVRPHLTKPENKDSLELVKSVNVDTHRWWILNALVIHDVVGITGKRSSITAGIGAMNPFTVLRGYGYVDLNKIENDN